VHLVGTCYMEVDLTWHLAHAARHSHKLSS